VATIAPTRQVNRQNISTSMIRKMSLLPQKSKIAIAGVQSRQEYQDPLF